MTLLQSGLHGQVIEKPWRDCRRAYILLSYRVAPREMPKKPGYVAPAPPERDGTYLCTVLRQKETDPHAYFLHSVMPPL